MDWGNDKETLLFTYNAIIKPTLTFADPIWAPNTKKVHRDKLQIVKNKGLRIVTGCYKATSIDHVHSETQVLPVSNHLVLICTQFLAHAMRPAHPSHETVLCPSGPRQMKFTLQSRYISSLVPLLVNRIIPQVSYKRIINKIHTDMVAAVKSRLTNKHLQGPPPLVSKSEMRLPSWPVGL
jgi:hypothetical protein